MELVINFSGGKDSSATLAYICENFPDAKKHVVWADTGWEHPGMEKWCRSITDMFGLKLNVVRAKTDWFGIVRHRQMFPSPDCRICTSDLKRNQLDKWIRNNTTESVVYDVIGIRAEESAARAKKMPMEINYRISCGKRVVWNWLPILQWKEQEVYGYLDGMGIPLHPCYDYLSRLSCQVCIYNPSKELEAIRVNNPKAIDTIAELESEIGFTMKPGKGIYQACR